MTAARTAGAAIMCKESCHCLGEGRDQWRDKCDVRKLQSEEIKRRLNVEVKNKFEALRDMEAKIKRKN